MTVTTLPGVASASAHGACAHCGLDVPAGRRASGDEPSFCCDGCATVWTLLHEGGLAAWYARRERAGLPVERAGGGAGGFEEFDDPVFARGHVHQRADGTAEVTLAVENVHCAACVWLLERLPRVAPGVLGAELTRGHDTLRVRFDPTATRLSRVARTLDVLGHRPHPYRGTRSEEARRAEERALIARMGVAFAVAGNVMLLSFALYAGDASGMEASFRQLFRWLSLALAVPGVLVAGWPFFQGAMASLRTRVPHLDLPVAIGLTAGLAIGALHVAQGRGEIYFDTLTLLVFLLLVGRWLVQKQRRRAEDASDLLLSMTPSTARRVGEDGAVTSVPTEALHAGDRIELRAGDKVPADCEVVEGASAVDASLLSGESVPEEVGPGSLLHAGTLVVSAPLVARVVATGAATRLGALARAMEESRERRAPLVTEANALARRFVVAVLALAAATAAGWLVLDPSRALDATLALLVVTCPCALGMATPLAVTAALGKAARRGLLVKGGDVLEALGRPALLVLDKTGTLTEGRPRVLSWRGDESLAPLVAALESGSAHPVARALAEPRADEASAIAGRAAPRAEPPGHVGRQARDVLERRELPGGGVTGVVAGVRLAVGTARFLENTGVAVPAEQLAEAERAASRGETPVLVARNGRVEALACLGDRERPEAREAVASLVALGFHPVICSGDHPAVVRRVARSLGIPEHDAHGGMSPERKLAFVEQARRQGPVVMVGDGANDAAALAAATAGVAVHGSAEVSLEAASAFSHRPGLEAVVELAQGARRALLVIRRGLTFSLLYNAVGATLSVLGLMTPLLAAVLMPASSLTVVTNAFRSRTFPEEPAP